MNLEVRNTKFDSRFAGYHPIWEANTPTNTSALPKIFATPVTYDDLAYFSIHLDATRLSIQILATLIVIVLFCAILHSKPKPSSKRRLLGT